MKNIFLILLIFNFGIITAQNNDFFDIGVVAGYNFGSNGELKDDFTSTNLNSGNKSGYHAGIYLNFNLKSIYLRPEILYTKTKSEYDSNDFGVAKIDVPILFGKKIFKSFSIFAGPSLQYTLDTELQNIETTQIDIENEIAINGQFGLAIQLGEQIRLDARYEIGISENYTTISNNTLNQNIVRIDNKPNQLILSISLQL